MIDLSISKIPKYILKRKGRNPPDSMCLAVPEPADGLMLNLSSVRDNNRDNSKRM